MSDINDTPAPHPSDAEVWPPPPKRSAEATKEEGRTTLLGRVADPLAGLFAGVILSVALTIGGQIIANDLWVRAGHYSKSNGHQPLSLIFWSLGLLLTLSIALPFRRFSALFLMFVVSSVGMAILTITEALEVLK
jgi:hypothetical protein